MMAAPFLVRVLPLRTRLQHHRLAAWLLDLHRRPVCTVSAESTRSEELAATRPTREVGGKILRVNEPPQLRSIDDTGFRAWKDTEEAIMRDIEPITNLTKEILHSKRYGDGECLRGEDEKVVVDKLLAHHPHAEDKIGCGIESIMVDRHPQFQCSRCLFVVRTDGVWIDFSYQKCIREYIRRKYPLHAERFIREHFKRGSGNIKYK